MKPEHEALVGDCDSAIAMLDRVGYVASASLISDMKDAIVSLSSELARYREAPTVGFIQHTRTTVDFEATPYCYELDSGTELIVRPTEAK